MEISRFSAHTHFMISFSRFVKSLSIIGVSPYYLFNQLTSFCKLYHIICSVSSFKCRYFKKMPKKRENTGYFCVFSRKTWRLSSYLLFAHSPKVIRPADNTVHALYSTRTACRDRKRESSSAYPIRDRVCVPSYCHPSAAQQKRYNDLLSFHVETK